MVRAVFVGEAQVGKSSIIKCYISNNFDDTIAAVIPVAVLPPEASPEGVPLTLVDTSSKDVEGLEDEVQKADVAVVVYAADRPDTLARVGSHWLPRLRDLRADMPVIVVGNKLDLRSGDAHAIESELRSAAGPIMEIFRQVETLMDCSAKKMINVSELMLFATKAVLHPTAPLYDTGSHELKPACVRALTRVFALCDSNEDGVLDDTELNKFQREVFGTPLLATQITGIKNLLRRNVKDGVTDAGITVSGFLYLHKLFIQRGRAETTWEVLRAFYYGPNLRLLPERLPALSSLTADQSCQLAPETLAYLSSLFWQHDIDGNGALTSAQVPLLYSTLLYSLYSTLLYSNGALASAQVTAILFGSCVVRGRLGIRAYCVLLLASKKQHADSSDKAARRLLLARSSTQITACCVLRDYTVTYIVGPGFRV